ncbi:AI-2E family transporter [Patescibacteria group bacterium]|nr:AI-2E family transporter [Patescibacteria group bacterium]
MPDPKACYQVNMSTYTILKVVGVILVLLFLYSILEVVGIIFVAWVFASAIDPLIDRMQRYKIPRGISILLIYMVLIAILTVLVVLMAPPIFDQIKEISVSLPAYFDKVEELIPQSQDGAAFSTEETIQNLLNSASESLGSAGSQLFSAAANVLTAIVGLVAVFVIAFYMTVHEDNIKKFMQLVAPTRMQPYLIQKMHKIQRKLASWLWGQIILMVIIGLLAFIGLKILGVEYALLLAIIAGFGEFIPIVGPVVSAIPAVFFAFSDSPIKALLVIILFVVIQQLENNIIVPKVMNKAVGLNPLIIIMAMLVGAKLAGFVGLLLAIPAATILGIFLQDFFNEKEKEDLTLEEEKPATATASKSK